MEKKRRLIWDEHALMKLEKSLKRISQKSILQAEKVEEAILQKLEETRMYPERHRPDKYKRNNSGEYRAFETHSFRVSYRYTDDVVMVLYCRHVREYPRKF